ncbi:MAG: hypothetical protein U9N81_08090 [Bacillota bacterium]|nr:hypothetical protein [Bacillota bacterium]
MPLPWAILSAIILVALWFFASWLLIPCVFIGGLICYASRHLHRERVKSGEWNIDWGIFLENALGGGLIVFILFIFSQVDIREPLVMLVLSGVVLVMTAYAIAMALVKR